jgi:site-specific recombinase XerD
MFLSLEETERLLRYLNHAVQTADAATRATASTDRVLIAGLLFSGLRNSEFCGLRLGDTGVVTGRSSLVVGTTPRQDREVVIPAPVNQLIAQYCRNVRPQLLPAGVDPGDPDQPLILNERRNPYERTAMYRRIVRILTAAGLGDRASVQLLRHTYGYLGYLRTGGNLLFLQRQMGHAHPMVTSIYAQFVEESDPGLANAIADGFFPNSKPTAPAKPRAKAAKPKRT